MHRVLGEDQHVAVLDVGVRDVHVQHGVVGAHGGAQQQRAAPFHRELEPGQEPGVPVVQAERIAAPPGQVAVMIEQREGIAVFERPRWVVDERIVRRDVKRLRDVFRPDGLRFRGHRRAHAATRPSARASTRR
jgi:hypothetical protein